MLTFSDHLGLLIDVTRNSKKKLKPKASEIMSNQEDCKAFNESNLILFKCRRYEKQSLIY